MEKVSNKSVVNSFRLTEPPTLQFCHTSLKEFIILKE